MTGIEVEPVRPRAATVVAVVWLYLSISWLVLSAIMILAVLQLAQFARGETAWLGILPLFISGIATASILGLRGALGMLKLQNSGRLSLELANWVTFGTLGLFTLSFCRDFAQVPGYFSRTTYFDPSRALLPLFIGLLFSLPFAVMARKLRGAEVRYAVRDAEMRRLSTVR